MAKISLINQHQQQKPFFKSSMLILCSVCFSLIFAVNTALYNQFYNSLLEQSKIKATQILAEYETLLSEAKNTAVTLDLFKSVSVLSENKEPNLSQLVRMSEDVTAIANASFFHSIELFLLSSEQIYVSGLGMYDYDEYFDQSLLTSVLAQQNKNTWVFNRKYNQLFYNPVDIFTYFSQDAIISGTGKIVVAVNVNTNELANIVSLYSDNLPVSLSYEDNKIYETGSLNKHFAVSKQNEFEVSCGIDTNALNDYLGKNIIISIVGAIISFFICVLISYIYSLYMARPTLALLQKVQELTRGEIVGEDLSVMVDAIKQLDSRVRQMDKYIEKNTTTIQERLLLKLLTTPTEFTTVEDECKECKLVFNQAYFAVFLMQLDLSIYGNKELVRENNIQIAKETATEFFKTLGNCYTTLGENEVVLGVLNMGHDCQMKEHINSICMALSESLKATLGIKVHISIGLCSSHSPLLYRAYFGAKRNLEYMTSDTDEYICFSSQEDYKPYTDTVLIERLSQAIFMQNSSEVEDLLCYYKKWNLQDEISISQAIRMTDVCLSSIFTRLCEQGVEVSEKQMASAIRKISAETSTETIFTLFREYLLTLLYSNKKVSDRSHNYVTQTVKYVEENYTRNFSIPELADAIQLNPVYLNKLFKTATGKSVSEYLNSYRVEQSLELLKEKGLSIQEISARLGYPDVRNYMRFFKKFHGVTPSEYRKNMTTDC